MKTILITGGSRGIGAAVCTALINRGDKVVCLSRTEPTLFSPGLHWIKTDIAAISGNHSINNALNGKIKEYGYIFDAIIMNAGIAKRVGWINETEESLLLNFKVHAIGHYALLQSLYSNNMLREHCNIINVISKTAFESNPEQPAYCASKAAQYSLFSSAAKELVKKGIQINHLIPGSVETEMNPVREDETGWIEPHKKPEQVVSAFLYLVDQPPGGMNDSILDLRRRR